MKKREIKSKDELLEVLKKLPIENKKHRNSIVCSLIGHSLICTACFGYRYCARCGDQLGDSLGSIDYGREKCVFVGHNCTDCRKNYKECTWKDKVFTPNPFKKSKKDTVYKII